MRIVFLGTGTSHGIPMIGCDCAVCTSKDPRDQRLRTSVAIEAAGRCLLIDTTPELRLQCIANGIRRVDAVLFTHHHADHVTGLDDLRRFNELQRSQLPCYADARTATCLRRMFDYAFEERPGYLSAKPRLRLHAIEGPFEVEGLSIVPIPLMHGCEPVFGFRCGRFAYCTDVSAIPESSYALLADLDVLVLDGLRRRPHPTHFHLDRAVEEAGRIKAARTYFTHIAHELGHASTCAELPAGMALAYDGQVAEIAM